ncbi:MAG: PaaI family thioesterase [Deltaproteobacteria bacterium]|nr:MAG: PaaI family thioesterase [Deltaproteobacteria bacterium]
MLRGRSRPEPIMSIDIPLTMPFVHLLGIAEICTTAGVIHGGALMAFADSLGALCAFMNLPAGATTATIESKTNFFRPVTKGAVHGTTTPLHVGRTTIVAQTDLRDDAGKRVALVTQTQAVINRA